MYPTMDGPCYDFYFGFVNEMILCANWFWMFIRGYDTSDAYMVNFSMRVRF